MQSDKTKDITEARKAVKVNTGLIAGTEMGANAAATTSYHSKFVVRAEVDVKYPDREAGRVEALTQILTGVVSHFPNMTMEGVIKAMKQALEKKIWDGAMGANLRDHWLSQTGVHIQQPYRKFMYERKVFDYDESKKLENAHRQAQVQNMQNIREQSELERLRQKLSYMEDVHDFSLEELREIDNYTTDLKGDVKI